MLTNSISTGMANLLKAGRLEPSSNDEVLLDLTCTDGQPLHSRVSKFTVPGETTLISRFRGSVQGQSLGRASTVLNRTIRIFSTLHDRRELVGEQPTGEMKLRVRLRCGKAVAEHTFVHKAQGTGEILTCVFEVAVVPGE